MLTCFPCSAHCRRRKIRCMLAEGDLQQNCQNCIHVNKKCDFSPVEQQRAAERKFDCPSKPEMSSAAFSVESSPPRRSAETAFAQPREFGAFPSLPSNELNTFQGLPTTPGSARPSQGQSVEDLHQASAVHGINSLSAAVPGSLAQRNYAYQSPEQAHPTWKAFRRCDQFPQQHPKPFPSNADRPQQGIWSYGRQAAVGDVEPIPTRIVSVSQSPLAASYFAFNKQQGTNSTWPQQPSMR